MYNQSLKTKSCFSFMKYHDLVYLVILCVHAYVCCFLPDLQGLTFYQWYSPFPWALFMTSNNCLGPVKRLKNLIGIWIGPLEQYSGYTKETGQAKQQLCQVGWWPAEGSSSILTKGILTELIARLLDSGWALTIWGRQNAGHRYRW